MADVLQLAVEHSACHIFVSPLNDGGQSCLVVVLYHLKQRIRAGKMAEWNNLDHSFAPSK